MEKCNFFIHCNFFFQEHKFTYFTLLYLLDFHIASQSANCEEYSYPLSLKQSTFFFSFLGYGTEFVDKQYFSWENQMF